jgi:hypothetical protein
MGPFSWVERLQTYVDRWATALENLVEEVRPHDDTAWEVYIQWYTPEDSGACDVRPTTACSAASGRDEGAC